MNRVLVVAFFVLSVVFSFVATEVKAKSLHPLLQQEFNPADNTTMVFAGEQTIKGNVSLSAGYVYSGQKFSMPTEVGITFYGQHNAPKWNRTEKLIFRFKGKQIETIPNYRIETQDGIFSSVEEAGDGPCKEMLLVNMPLSIAKRIAANNGLVIATKPSVLNLFIPASKMSAFKALVNSLSNPPRPAKSTFSINGLPLTEIVQGSGRGYMTTPIILPSRVTVFAIAMISFDGKRVRQPYVLLTFSSHNPTPRWLGQTSAVLSFAGRRLMLSGTKSTDVNEQGLYTESLQINFPHRDFIAFAKSGKSYFTIGNSSFAISKEQSLGLKSLGEIVAGKK